MRGHKFLILEGDSCIIEGEFDDSNLCDQIVWNDMECLTVVTCAHENFEDNVIQLQSAYDPESSFSVVRDINSRLYYFMEHLTKHDLVRMFEQVDE